MTATSLPIDINPTHLDTIQSILNEHVPDCEVRAFGSRATWNANDYSDLDLAVVGDQPLEWRALGRLKDAFEESTLPFRVDVLDWHDISDNFRKMIEADCTPIKKATATSKVRDRTTLGAAAEIVMGQSPPGSTVSPNDGTPLLNGPSEFGVNHPTPVQFTTDPRRYAQPGDILFCVRGSTGKMNWADREYAIGRGLAAIRHRKSPDLQPFLRAVIEHGLPYLLAEATGSIFSNISAQQLQAMSFPLFSESEQRDIAHILGTLDDKIELNRRMNETLEAMAQALFKSWFVDFDPVRAKMEGRWQLGESLPGLPAHLYDLFPNRLVPSELGNIPEDWRIGCFGDLAKQVLDKELPLDSPTTLFKHFSIPAFDSEHSPSIEIGSDIRSQKIRIYSGVILISKLNPEIERVWLADVKKFDKAVCSTEFLVLQPQPPYGRYMIYCVSRSTAFRQKLIGLVTGTSKSHQRAPAKAVLKLASVLPPQPITKQFEQFVSPILDKTQINRTELSNKIAIRDFLLPILMDKME